MDSESKEMRTGKRRRWIGSVVAALTLSALAAIALWMSQREAEATRIERVDPSVIAPAPGSSLLANDAEPGDPAAELLRARRPGTIPRVSTFTRSYDPPPGRAVDVIAALRPRAEAGDADAAFYIFVKVEGCRYQLYHGRGNESQPPLGADDSLEAQLIARTPPECHGLTLEQYQGNVRWLEQAADSGLVMAQLSYASNAEAVVGNSSQMLSDPERVIAYRRKAMGYVRQAAAGGSLEALHKLSDAYHYGVLVRRDALRAYAYAYAEDLAAPSRYGKRRLDAYAAQLDPAQLAAATQQGRRIYDACCRQ